MTTQYLPKFTHSAVLDECSSWIERTLVRAAETLAAVRTGKSRQTQLHHFSKLSPRQLNDIGLDDPQVQMRLLGSRIESGNEYLANIRNLFQVRR